jgi:hypothetical protein
VRNRILIFGICIAILFGCKKGSRTCVSLSIPVNTPQFIRAYNGIEAIDLSPNRIISNSYYYIEPSTRIIELKSKGYTVDTIYPPSNIGLPPFGNDIEGGIARFIMHNPNGYYKKEIVDCDSKDASICCQ